MKKLLALGMFALIILACGTPKTVTQSRKVIKGYWSLDDISYSEKGKFNIQLLSDTSAECFQGSSWRFIPNNNTGIYTINGGDCPTGDRYFIFDIEQENAETGLYDFKLKPTNEKHKSATNVGFRLNLTKLTESSMQWQQTVSLEGKPFTITMNFSKQSE